MKEKNGFTVIELVVSFTLISIIVVGMLTIALRYRNDAQLSAQRLELERYKDTLTRAIQDDILNYGIENIEYCQAGVSDIQTCLVFTFLDGTTKNLKIVNNDVYNRYIRYGGQMFPIEEFFPVEPSGEEDTVIRLPKTISLKSTEVNGFKIFKIDIPIYHMDIEGEHGLHIVTMKNPSTKAPDSDNPNEENPSNSNT